LDPSLELGSGDSSRVSNEESLTEVVSEEGDLGAKFTKELVATLSESEGSVPAGTAVR
jgi:hypothetical protein